MRYLSLERRIVVLDSARNHLQCVVQNSFFEEYAGGAPCVSKRDVVGCESSVYDEVDSRLLDENSADSNPVGANEDGADSSSCIGTSLSGSDSDALRETNSCIESAE